MVYLAKEWRRYFIKHRRGLLRWAGTLWRSVCICMLATNFSLGISQGREENRRTHRGVMINLSKILESRFGLFIRSPLQRNALVGFFFVLFFLLLRVIFMENNDVVAEIRIRVVKATTDCNYFDSENSP